MVLQNYIQYMVLGLHGRYTLWWSYSLTFSKCKCIVQICKITNYKSKMSISSLVSATVWYREQLLLDKLSSVKQLHLADYQVCFKHLVGSSGIKNTKTLLSEMIDDTVTVISRYFLCLIAAEFSYNVLL